MSKLNNEGLTEEESGVFKDLMYIAAKNNNGNIPKDVVENIQLMKKNISNINTTAGRKYALSVLLNDPRFGFDKDVYYNNSKHQDAWSIKNQNDFKAPDVIKAEEKLDKENLFNWDSNRHWTKLGTKELERKATNAGYTDVKPYINKLGEIQTQKDTDNALKEKGYNIYGSIFTPRVFEAYSRREDPTAKDYALDMGENTMYMVNPVGRSAKSLIQGSKYAKNLGLVNDLINVAANPVAMEFADAIAYDDPNNDRSNPSVIDMLWGAGINAGMNKVANPSRLKNKFVYPVEESNAQNAAKALAPEQIEQNTAHQNMLDITKDELRRQHIRDNFATVQEKRDLIDVLKEDLKNGQKPNEDNTTFKQRIKSDVKAIQLLGDLASNKAGDVASDNPEVSKWIIRKGLRGVPAVGQAINEAADVYYGVDENEKNKILELLGSQR